MNCEQPNIHALDNAADDWFDPYQYRLYGRYCRVCQTAEDGVCREGTRELAKQCQMSVGKVSSVRAWLKEQGYITYKEGRGDQPYETSLLERSPHEHLSDSVHHMNESVSPHEQQGVHHTNDTVHEGESVHSMNTNEPETPPHVPTRAGLEKLKDQELKSLNTQGQVLKDKSDGDGGDNAGARAKIFDQYTALTKRPIESKLVVDQLKDDAEAYPADWIDDAVTQAALNGVTTWNYVRKALQARLLESKDTSRPATVKGARVNGNHIRGSPAAAPPAAPPIALTSLGAPLPRKAAT